MLMITNKSLETVNRSVMDTVPNSRDPIVVPKQNVK